MNEIRGPYKFPYILGATKLLQFFQIATSADNGTTIYRLGIVTGQHHLVIPFYQCCAGILLFLKDLFISTPQVSCWYPQHGHLGLGGKQIYQHLKLSKPWGAQNCLNHKITKLTLICHPPGKR